MKYLRSYTIFVTKSVPVPFFRLIYRMRKPHLRYRFPKYHIGSKFGKSVLSGDYVPPVEWFIQLLATTGLDVDGNPYGEYNVFFRPKKGSKFFRLALKLELIPSSDKGFKVRLIDVRSSNRYVEEWIREMKERGYLIE